MKTELVDINKLTPAEVNVRNHGVAQIDAMIKSITAFGQVRPIVVDENYIIIAGHGLHEAMVKMGKTSAIVLKMDNLSEVEKRKLMLADNKVYELGTVSNEGVMKVLEEIKLDGGDFDIAGYDEDILDSLFNDLKETDEELNSYGTVSEESVEKLIQIREDAVNDNIPEGERKIHINPEVVEIHQEAPDTPPRPYVECKECGARIWL